MINVDSLSHLPSISISHYVPVPVQNTNNLDNATNFQNILIKNWHYLVIGIPLVVNPFSQSSSFCYEQFIAPQIYRYITL